MSSENQENKESKGFDVHFGKLGKLLKEAAGDLKDFLTEEKVYEGESFFELFEKNIKGFNNPLKSEETEEFLKNNREKFESTIKNFKEKISNMRVKETNSNSFLVEKENSYSIEVLALGISKSELNVEFDEKGNTITITSSIEESNESSVFKNNIFIEYSFEDDVDLAMTTSKLENGILTITIPKKSREEEKSTTKVEIN
jgi:HSP20 family protein